MRLVVFIPLMAIIGLLSVSPAIAYDYSLGIFGNANLDDTINEDDLSYVVGIIDGTNERTELADANYDGEIDEEDLVQIEAIIDGQEIELILFDSAGRTVVVKRPIEKIVCCHSNVVETLRSLDATDKIVGLDDKTLSNEEFFPEFVGISSVGGWEPDLEKIFELQPDLIFVYPVSGEPVVEKFGQIGIPVICVDCYKPQTYVKEVQKLGYVLGKRDEAQEFLDFYLSYMDHIEEVVQAIPDSDKPPVYLGWKFDPYKTGGQQSGYHWKIIAAGGQNIFGDLEPMYPAIDPEEIMERDPQIIIWTPSKMGGYSLNVNETSDLQTIRQQVLNRPELQGLAAVKNDKVYLITDHILGGARNFVSIGYLAKWFHPELFQDLDPKAVHQEYLTRFQGLDYDLDGQGVFAYPSLDE